LYGAKVCVVSVLCVCVCVCVCVRVCACVCVCVCVYDVQRARCYPNRPLAHLALEGIIASRHLCPAGMLRVVRCLLHVARRDTLHAAGLARRQHEDVHAVLRLAAPLQRRRDALDAPLRPG
jgi:hypothetical protein